MKLLLLYIYIFLPLIQFSDQNEMSYFSVEWLNEFSYEKDFKTDESILSNLLRIVTGENENKLVKPFNLVQIDKNSYFILDQGLFSPLIASEDGIEIINNDDHSTFPSLVGVCRFKEKKILFTDSKLSKIFKYDIEEKELEYFQTNVKLDKPTGLVYDTKQNKIYVTETNRHRVLVLSEYGELLTTIGNRGKSAGQFNYPSFLTLDSSGRLYVVDALNFRVQIFDVNGNFVSAFGEAGDATGFFNRPKGISIDSYGHIFLVDAMFHTVQVFDRDGNFLYNFGGLGSLNSQFWLPTGIDIDEENNIYIADSYNARIQVFRLMDGQN